MINGVLRKIVYVSLISISLHSLPFSLSLQTFFVVENKKLIAAKPHVCIALSGTKGKVYFFNQFFFPGKMFKIKNIVWFHQTFAISMFNLSIFFVFAYVSIINRHH